VPRHSLAVAHTWILNDRMLNDFRSQTHGFAFALSMSSAAFLLAAATWAFIPETKGRRLEL